ncbi:MAG: hypothetical protein RID42_15175 [Alphaproteobacteria bacterium]
MLWLLAATLLALGFLAPAAAQDSMRAFGGGAPEQAVQAGGLEAPGFVQRYLIEVRRLQRDLQTKLADAVGAVRDGRSAWPVLVLIGLSFAYGVLHAAGPGHGKVVIASYLLAGEGNVRRGVVLAVLAALLQAVAAVALVGLLAVILGASNLATSDRVGTLETASYAFVAVLGLWLMWRAVREVLGFGHGHHGHDHGEHGHDHGHGRLAKAASAGWREAAAVVLAVGMRPCSGAVIVLLFATAQSLFMLGVAAALAMSVGTAITVSVLAALSVAVRRGALRQAGASGRWRGVVAGGLAIAGASVVTAFGTLSLAAALAA